MLQTGARAYLPLFRRECLFNFDWRPGARQCLTMLNHAVVKGYLLTRWYRGIRHLHYLGRTSRTESIVATVIIAIVVPGIMLRVSSPCCHDSRLSRAQWVVHVATSNETGAISRMCRTWGSVWLTLGLAPSSLDQTQCSQSCWVCSHRRDKSLRPPWEEGMLPALNWMSLEEMPLESMWVSSKTCAKSVYEKINGESTYSVDPCFVRACSRDSFTVSARRSITMLWG